MSSESQTVFNNDVHIAGALTCRTMSIPAGTITDAAIAAGAAIQATKVQQQHVERVSQAPGAAVVAQTVDVHLAAAAGVVVSIEAVVTGAIATGADRQVSIDLQLGNAADAFATILTAPIVLDDATVLRTVVAGAINTADFVDGDVLRVVITVAGAAGNQAQGLIVSVVIREAPQ